MNEDIHRLISQAATARRERRPLDARRDLEEAVTRGRRCGDREGLIDALRQLGQIERDLANLDAARRSYDEAVSLCRDEGDTPRLAHALRHLGEIHVEEGDTLRAESCYLEALSIYRKESGTPALELANAIRPLALLRERTGDAGAARPLWKEAMDLNAAMDVQAGVAECSRHIG